MLRWWLVPRREREPGIQVAPCAEAGELNEPAAASTSLLPVTLSLPALRPIVAEPG